MSLASWLSERISDLEKVMDEELERPSYTTEEASFHGGRLAALLEVEDYIANQESK